MTRASYIVQTSVIKRADNQRQALTHRAGSANPDFHANILDFRKQAIVSGSVLGYAGRRKLLQLKECRQEDTGHERTDSGSKLCVTQDES